MGWSEAKNYLLFAPTVGYSSSNGKVSANAAYLVEVSAGSLSHYLQHQIIRDSCGSSWKVSPKNIPESKDLFQGFNGDVSYKASDLLKFKLEAAASSASMAVENTVNVNDISGDVVASINRKISSGDAYQRQTASVEITPFTGKDKPKFTFSFTREKSA